MRSARLLLATATATAALAIAAPGALAADGGDWDNGDSSYSKEHDKDSKHEKPSGGVHTGGGALTAVNEGDWSKDDSADESKKGTEETDKKEEGDKGDWSKDDSADESKKGTEETDKKEEGGKGDWGSKHEKPSGGLHTGGGALTAVNEGDWSKDDSADESKKGTEETDKKEEGGKGDWGSKHEKPSGGVHTGGGALAAVNEGDWSKDESKKGDWEADKEEGAKEEGGKGDWGSKHEKPSGGVHTGGGALAAPGVTAGGLAALAVVGAGAFAMRRRNAADGVS